jgi:hypothetical protein
MEEWREPFNALVPVGITAWWITIAIYLSDRRK